MVTIKMYFDFPFFIRSFATNNFKTKLHYGKV